MLKKILLLLLALCLSAETFAQITNIDSLKQLLVKEKQDTTRVLLLNELSFSYLLSKPDSTMILALEGLQLSRHIGFLKGEAESLNLIGSAYRFLVNNLKALEFFLQALKINEKILNDDGLANNNNNIGTIYAGMGDHRQALIYYFKASELSRRLNNEQSLSLHLGNIGKTYVNLKKLDSARIFTQQSYDLAVKIKYPRAIGYSLRILGEIYAQTGQNTLALEFYRLTVPQQKKARDFVGLSSSFLGMARVFRKTKQIDSALFYARQAMAIDKERGTLAQVGLSNFLFSIYESKGDTDSALFYLKMAKTASDSLSSKEKQQALQGLAFDEKLRQQELATIEFKAKEERKHDLQYAAIAIGLICFIILFFALSRSIIVKPKFIEFFGVLGLLAVFEFINLFIHPYLDKATNHSPVFMLLVLIVIGALLIPLHHKLEKWMTHVMVEKNKKIRLEAAKKTIATLESN
jgi:tetratricopeptide (TPR) repeat protein